MEIAVEAQCLTACNRVKTKQVSGAPMKTTSSVQGPSRRSAFTLIELVIVVLVLGIIAAIAAPKMFDTATNAREAASRQSLTVVRGAVELYRAQTGAYPSAASITTDLRPYLQGPFPAPQVGANAGNATVVASTQNPIATAESGTDGWAYNATTGEVRINAAAPYITW